MKITKIEAEYLQQGTSVVFVVAENESNLRFPVKKGKVSQKRKVVSKLLF